MTPFVAGKRLLVSGSCVATVKPSTVVRPGGCGLLASKTEAPLDQAESSNGLPERYQARPRSIPSALYFQDAPSKLSNMTSTDKGTSPPAKAIPFASVTALVSMVTV